MDACGYSDDLGTYGNPGTIWLIEDPGYCYDPLENLFLHEAGHSLGLAHDGLGCPSTVMTGNAATPLVNHVSPVNCRAVARFKREKVNRDRGITPPPPRRRWWQPGLWY